MSEIRVAYTPDGDIEAAYPHGERVVIDSRTGDVVANNVGEGSDVFRRLVRAARVYIVPARFGR